MKKMTRLVLISAVFVTSGLTAKIATENYKAAVDNDERIQKSYELAKKPNKAAVLEAIVDATNTDSDERIQNAVVLEPEEPKTPKVVRVTTSAGVSPISSVMDKKTVNKAEEFIEKIVHPVNIPIQKLPYEFKDIFPEFEEVEKETLTYKITLPIKWSMSNYYVFAVNGIGTNESTHAWDYLNLIIFLKALNGGGNICATSIVNKDESLQGPLSSMGQAWMAKDNSTNIVKVYPETRSIDYSALLAQKDCKEPVPGALDGYYVIGHVPYLQTSLRFSRRR